MISFNLFFLAAVLDDLEWFLIIRTLLMAPFHKINSVQAKHLPFGLEFPFVFSETRGLN
jgi:hypothetical protein